MRYKKLGARGPIVSAVGFGAWGISGRDWGKTDDNQSKLAIRKAFDNGVTFIDTADVYGFGHSEELIGEVLKERGGKKDIIIATKAGNNFYPYLNENHDVTPYNPDYSKKHLIKAAEESLKRLGVEVIDILQLHSPVVDLLEQDEPWEALEKLKKDGKILHAGWSVRSFEETSQAHILDQHPELIDVIQVRYNILEREAERVLFPKAMKYGIGVIARIPILFGLLTGKFTREHRFSDDDHRKMNLSPEQLEKYLDKFEELKPVYSQFDGYTKGQVSLGFCISHPACQTVIPGCKTGDQVMENIKAAEIDSFPMDKLPKIINSEK
jgi:aryl-alcohol dehydrogenase-like predicted oxidoreductase